MDFTQSDRFRRKKLISVIIPVYNEENNIERAYFAVCKVFSDDLNNNYDFEIIFYQPTPPSLGISNKK